MLNGKVAVVTGGSRGIGKAVCKLFAQNGANVALLYAGNEAKANETVQELLECGVKAAAYKCNVADFAETKETFGKIVDDFGTVDILVNNAGQTRDMLMVRMDDSDFGDIIDINLKGVFNTVKQVYRIFTKKKSDYKRKLRIRTYGKCGTGQLFCVKSWCYRTYKIRCKGACVKRYYLQCHSTGFCINRYDNCFCGQSAVT